MTGRHWRRVLAGFALAAFAFPAPTQAATRPAFSRPLAVEFAPAMTVPAIWPPTSVALANFNHDGLTDIVYTYGGGMVVLLADSGLFYRQSADVRTGSLATSVAVADFNEDGFLDLACVESGSAPLIYVALGNGDGTFHLAVPYAAARDLRDLLTSLAVADFDGDGHVDLAAPGIWGSGLAVLLGRGDGTFATYAPYHVGSGPEGISAGDLDGDGIADALVANAGSNTLSLLCGFGTSHFSVRSLHTGAWPTSAAIADLNADGWVDLLSTNSFGNTISLLLQGPANTFVLRDSLSTGTYPQGLVVSDFDSDGLPDVATANRFDATVSVFRERPDGSFELRTDFPAGALPSALAVGDLNGDGKPDLAVGNAASSTLSILVNETATSVVGRGQGDDQARMRPTLVGEPYPNPARNRIVVPITLAATSRVAIALYDARGARISSLLTTILPAGAHRVSCDVSIKSLPPSRYVLEVVTPAGRFLRPVILLR